MAEVEGTRPCPFCGATVEVKINKSGRAYFVCNGAADLKACASNATLGPIPTQALMAEIDRKKGATNDGGQDDTGSVSEGDRNAGSDASGDGGGGDAAGFSIFD